MDPGLSELKKLEINGQNSIAPGSTFPKSTLKRDIGPLTIIAIGFVVCNSWVGVGSTMAIAISLGGTVTLMYGIIIMTIVYLSIAITLAELAAVYPTAGGQYHFTSILAPERFHDILSYFCGFVSVFSWIGLGSAVTIAITQGIIAFIALLNENYTIQGWHYIVIFQIVVFVTFLYNILLLKRTPWIQDIACESIHSLNLL